MLHTPTKKSDVPKARLGAVTRKENEINEILRNHPQDRDLIEKLFTEYLVKVNSFIESCEGYPDYLSQHMPRIASFRAEVESIVHPAPSSARKSASGYASSRVSSSASRALTKLAAQKAKNKATLLTAEKERLLADKEMKLRHDTETEMKRLNDEKQKIAEEKDTKENTKL